jgi:hypothetical protein
MWLPHGFWRPESLGSPGKVGIAAPAYRCLALRGCGRRPESLGVRAQPRFRQEFPVRTLAIAQSLLIRSPSTPENLADMSPPEPEPGLRTAEAARAIGMSARAARTWDDLVLTQASTGEALPVLNDGSADVERGRTHG